MYKNQHLNQGLNERAADDSAVSTSFISKPYSFFKKVLIPRIFCFVSFCFETHSFGSQAVFLFPPSSFSHFSPKDFLLFSPLCPLSLSPFLSSLPSHLCSLLSASLSLHLPVFLLCLPLLLYSSHSLFSPPASSFSFSFSSSFRPSLYPTFCSASLSLVLYPILPLSSLFIVPWPKGAWLQLLFLISEAPTKPRFLLHHQS